MRARRILSNVTIAACSLLLAADALAVDPPRFVLEVEAGPTWQSRNDVQVPNDASGTRFSMQELVGSGPLPAARLYLTWNVASRHGVRLLLAPLSYTKPGTFGAPVDFAGASYAAGTSVDGTYKFNSWRIGYRYQLTDGDRWKLWVGGTVKIRDAKIALRQGDTYSEDTDVGFVPLLHFAATYRAGDRWSVAFDFDGLAGGPGRALDASLKIGYDLSERWRLTAGYRVLEGGVDIDRVYNFAWFNGAVLSGVYRF